MGVSTICQRGTTCFELVTKDHPCPKHPPRSRRAEMDQHRGSSSARGYGSRWKKYRDAYLAKHPLCLTCQRNGRVAAASTLDHVKPHRGAHALFWAVPVNVQPLCDACDGAKKPRENGLATCPGHGAGTADVLGERICRDCGRVA